jgi:uncharacterized damage-inducible protein DinB
MDKRPIDWIIRMANQEFRGKSLNFTSLMETCRALGAEEAASTDTYEGYSAWDNLVHCLFFKWDLLKILQKEGPVSPYPWAEGSFPPIEDTSPAAWDASLEYAEKLHDHLMRVLAELPQEAYEETHPRLKVSLKDSMLFLANHDTYHTAQIRNMGLPSFHKPRKK